MVQDHQRSGSTHLVTVVRLHGHSFVFRTDCTSYTIVHFYQAFIVTDHFI